MPDTPVKKVKTDKGDCQPLGRKYFKQSGEARITYIITPTAGTPIQRVLKRDYWTNIAPLLQRWSKVEVLPEDGEYYAELVVVDLGRNWADVVLHGEVTSLDRSKPVPEDSKHFVKFRGLIAGWAVCRKNDKTIVKGDFKSRATAVQWLENYENNTLG